MIDIADFAVGQSRMLYGNTMHSERPQHRMYEQWHPLGIVGTITAFNFPVAVWSWNACIAAICGNVNVWKPSPKTPLCGVAVQKICNEALADGWTCPRSFTCSTMAATNWPQQFVDDERVDLVSFTGSCAVGRKVGERVAATHGQVPARARRQQRDHRRRVRQPRYSRYRLSSSAPSARPDSAARRRAASSCIESRLEELKSALVNAYAQVRIGDPLAMPDTLMGPLIDESADATGSRPALDAVRKCGRRCSLRRRAPRRAGQLHYARDCRCQQRLGDRTDRDLRPDPVPDSLRHARRCDRDTERRQAGPVFGNLHGQPAERRVLPVSRWFRLRHCQRQHRHFRCRDRRRVRR